MRLIALPFLFFAGTANSQQLPIFDAHLHRALVSPDLVIPELRRYRNRSEVGTWFRDSTVISYLESRLSKYTYAGIGEFHLYGADADLPRDVAERIAWKNGEALFSSFQPR